MSQENSPENQLEALRTYTRLTGEVTDQQVKTLNAFPVVFLDGTMSHETRINLQDQEVEYVIKFPRGKTDLNREHYERLEWSVQSLMGANWKLRCVTKKKVIFEGVRRKELYRVNGVVIKAGGAVPDPNGK